VGKRGLAAAIAARFLSFFLLLLLLPTADDLLPPLAPLLLLLGLRTRLKILQLRLWLWQGGCCGLV